MLVFLLFYGSLLAAQAERPVVAIEDRAGSLPTLAASEVRRYFYLRTGEWLGLSAAIPVSGDAIVVARRDSPLLRGFAGADTGASSLKAQEYRIKSVSLGSRRMALIVGGDDLGTLYGAYRFAEKLGVRFYCTGTRFQTSGWGQCCRNWTKWASRCSPCAGSIPGGRIRSGSTPGARTITKRSSPNSRRCG